MLEHLGIHRTVGEVLDLRDIDRVLDWYVELIEAAIDRRDRPLSAEIERRHVQVPPRWPKVFDSRFSITLSGGVGQLAYSYRAGQPPVRPTQFGDLGGELAERLTALPCPTASAHWSPTG